MDYYTRLDIRKVKRGLRVAIFGLAIVFVTQVAVLISVLMQ